MNRKPRNTSTKATALTNPRPRRVSLCRAGANQTPLNACKAESVVVSKKELETMLTSMKAQGYAIASFAFEGEQWTRDAVKAWVDQGGYTDYEIKGDAGLYTVEAKGLEIAEGSELRTIKTDEGVAITLVKAPGEDAEPETPEVDPAEGAASDVQPVAKGLVDIVAKAEAAGAVLDQTVVKSLYDAQDMVSLVRGLKWLVDSLEYETFYANEYESGANPELEAVVAELKQIGNQMLTILATLVRLGTAEFAESFKSAQEETMTDTTKTPAEDTAEKTEAAGDAAVAATETAAEAVEAAVEGDAAKAEGDDAAAAEGAADEGAADEGAAEAVEAAKAEETTAEEAAPEADAAAKADDAPPAWASDLIASVKSLTERMDAADASKAEAATETETATVVPARKSADADEAAASIPEKSEAVKNFEARRLKSALGF